MFETCRTYQKIQKHTVFFALFFDLNLLFHIFLSFYFFHGSHTSPWFWKFSKYTNNSGVCRRKISRLIRVTWSSLPHVLEFCQILKFKLIRAIFKFLQILGLSSLNVNISTPLSLGFHSTISSKRKKIYHNNHLIVVFTNTHSWFPVFKTNGLHSQILISM